MLRCRRLDPCTCERLTELVCGGRFCSWRRARSRWQCCCPAWRWCATRPRMNGTPRASSRSCKSCSASVSTPTRRWFTARRMARVSARSVCRPYFACLTARGRLGFHTPRIQGAQSESERRSLASLFPQQMWNTRHTKQQTNGVQPASSSHEVLGRTNAARHCIYHMLVGAALLGCRDVRR